MSANAWVALPMSVARGREPVSLPQPSSVGDRIRALANRLSRPIDLEVRDAISQGGDALTDLEHRVDRMQHRMALSESGLQLKTELVRIGEAGVHLQHALPLQVGEEVQVFVDLTVWGASRLLVLPGKVTTSAPEAVVAFDGLTQDIRDTLVAFVFQEQGREIRHAHAVRSGD
jgi:hypothetical protein